MHKCIMTGLFLLLAAISPWPPALAATLTVNENGMLTGATGVNVGGTLYDVAFVEGNCATLFSGCDEQPDFLFADAATASAAAAALMDQVFVDGGGDLIFDSDPLRTFGCLIVSCSAYVPYMSSDGVLGQEIAYNHPSTYVDGISVSALTAQYNLADDIGGLYAVFTVPSVPEPSTWAMMLVGFGGMGVAFRRRRKLTDIAQLA